MKNLDNEIGQLLTQLTSSFDDKKRQMTQEQIKDRWFFEYDMSKSVQSNIYSFQYHLDLYRKSCRRWEEIHHGSSCVVERVRDTYLLPKIKEFEESLKAHLELGAPRSFASNSLIQKMRKAKKNGKPVLARASETSDILPYVSPGDLLVVFHSGKTHDGVDPGWKVVGHPPHQYLDDTNFDGWWPI